MSRALLLGIDGGGTSTAAWLADEAGIVLGRGEAGPSNVKAVGLEPGLAALDAAVDAAFADAGLEPSPVEVACLGLAGFDRPADRGHLREWNAARLGARRLVLINDADLVLAAGTPEGWGIALIAGTGSIAVGLGPDGRRARAGGWGHLFGDEGSAYAVAIEGLRLTACRADGRGPKQPDFLTRPLCRALDVAEPADLVTAVYGRGLDRAALAGLAPVVIEAARAGDGPAAAVVSRAARDLVRLVHTVAGSLGFGESSLPPLALAGGFLLGCGMLRDLVHQRLSRWGRDDRVAASEVPEPVAGAVLLARRELGRP